MDINKLQDALNYVRSEDTDIWLQVGSAIKTELGDAGFQMWKDWSSKADNYDEKSINSSWRSLKAGYFTAGTIIFYAKENGYEISNQDKQTYKEQYTDDSIDLEEKPNQLNKNNKKELEKEKLKEQQRIVNKAKYIWSQTEEVDVNHPYLKKKQIVDQGTLNAIRTSKFNGQNSLVVPMYNSKNQLRSLQFINENGQKIFLKGGQMKGNFVLLASEQSNIRKDGIVLAEGLATGATVHEATGKAVYVCFNAGNLIDVSKQLKNDLPPGSKVVIAADNDIKSGTGIKKATAAQEILSDKHQCEIIMPNFTEEQIEKFSQTNNGKLPSDFNDLKEMSGIDLVRDLFESQVKEDRIYIDVPFKEKDEVKQLGAKWDRDQKSWYVPGELDTRPFEKYMTKKDVISDKNKEQDLNKKKVIEESNQRTYINVPFKEKDEAKQLGAKWDRDQKSWYVPGELDINLFKKYMNNDTDQSISNNDVNKINFKNCIRDEAKIEMIKKEQKLKYHSDDILFNDKVNTQKKDDKQKLLNEKKRSRSR